MTTPFRIAAKWVPGHDGKSDFLNRWSYVLRGDPSEQDLGFLFGYVTVFMRRSYRVDSLGESAVRRGRTLLQNLAQFFPSEWANLSMCKSHISFRNDAGCLRHTHFTMYPLLDIPPDVYREGCLQSRSSPRQVGIISPTPASPSKPSPTSRACSCASHRTATARRSPRSSPPATPLSCPSRPRP